MLTLFFKELDGSFTLTNFSLVLKIFFLKECFDVILKFGILPDMAKLYYVVTSNWVEMSFLLAP